MDQTAVFVFLAEANIPLLTAAFITALVPKKPSIMFIRGRFPRKYSSANVEPTIYI
jgi:hypothetical protein